MLKNSRDVSPPWSLRVHLLSGSCRTFVLVSGPSLFLSSSISRWCVGVGQLEKTLSEERQVSASYRDRIRELEANLDDIASRSEQQQQTISLLVSEKTTLTSQLEGLQSAEAGTTINFH